MKCSYNKEIKGVSIMKRRLIIDGNAVYEIDEDCMLKKRIAEENEEKDKMKKEKEKESSKKEP